MSDKAKKIFLFLCIVVPFLLYSVYYYSIMFKNAPYKFSEFDHIRFEYGDGDTLVNKYDSRTGEYQYLTKDDSLVKKHIHLSQNQLLFLHRKAAEQGFWDFPSNEVNKQADTSRDGLRPPRYYIEFGYKRKTKKVMFDEAFDGDPKLKAANEQLIKDIQQILDEAEGGNKTAD